VERKNFRPVKSKAKIFADDAPLTASEMQTARRFSDCDPAFVNAIRKSLGRPPGRTKQSLHISLDSDIVKKLRDSGKGWQTRLNDLVRVAVSLMENTSQH